MSTATITTGTMGTTGTMIGYIHTIDWKYALDLFAYEDIIDIKLDLYMRYMGYLTTSLSELADYLEYDVRDVVRSVNRLCKLKVLSKTLTSELDGDESVYLLHSKRSVDWGPQYKYMCYVLGLDSRVRLKVHIYFSRIINLFLLLSAKGKKCDYTFGGKALAISRKVNEPKADVQVIIDELVDLGIITYDAKHKAWLYGPLARFYDRQNYSYGMSRDDNIELELEQIVKSSNKIIKKNEDFKKLFA